MTKSQSCKRIVLGRIVIGVIALIAFVFGNARQGETEACAAKSEKSQWVESFFVALQEAVAVTHSGETCLVPQPPDIQVFNEPNLRKSFAAMFKIRNAEGTIIAFGTELEVWAETDLITEGVLVDTVWTIVIPGRGTLFMHQIENAAELGPKVIQPTKDSGKDWEGDWTFTSTVGPRDDGRGVIVGGTGEFKGAKGSFIEIDRVLKYTVDGRLFINAELRVFFGM